MAIKPPSWCKDAIPTSKGWVHPRTGEVLVGGSITQKNIDEYFGKVAEETLPPAEEFVIQVDEKIDWDTHGHDDIEVHELDLDSMTKAELIETAEDWEVDIDTKATKAEIKAQLEEELF